MVLGVTNKRSNQFLYHVFQLTVRGIVSKRCTSCLNISRSVQTLTSESRSVMHCQFSTYNRPTDCKIPPPPREPTGHREPCNQQVCMVDPIIGVVPIGKALGQSHVIGPSSEDNKTLSEDMKASDGPVSWWCLVFGKSPTTRCGGPLWLSAWGYSHSWWPPQVAPVSTTGDSNPQELGWEENKILNPDPHTEVKHTGLTPVLIELEWTLEWSCFVLTS